MTDPNYRNGRSDGFGDPSKKPQTRRPNAGQRYPSLGKQVRNLGETAKQVIRNPKLASDELFQDRMSICKACDWYDERQNRCRKCGCMLKGKARFEASQCPLKKW